MVLVGAHMSIAGGVSLAFQRSKDLGADCLQLFAKSPRGWNFVYDKISQEEYQNSINNKQMFLQSWSVIHSIYLVNLAKSIDQSKNDIYSVIDDILVADKIGIDAINVHIGKYGELDKQQALENMVYNVGIILEQTKGLKPKFVFENTAGQGSEIGWNFEELGYLYDLLKDKFGKEYIEKRIGFCIDTAHARGAGYDIANRSEVMQEFDKYIGTDKIVFIHLNDSMAIKGSKLDRHASLGCGFIGLKGLSDVMKWAGENGKPLILETPMPERWPQEISMIREIISGSFDDTQIAQFHKLNYRSQILKKYQNHNLTLF